MIESLAQFVLMVLTNLNVKGVALPLPVPKRKSKESGEQQGWRGKESNKKERGVLEPKEMKGRGVVEKGRLEKSGRGGRLVERALRERK